MGIDCLAECPSCNRHVRCGERACPFCGAQVASFMRVLEYRLLTRLDRSRALSLGAAMTAAGFATNCIETEATPVYGAPCNPPSCVFPQAGTSGAATAGTAGKTTLGGAPADGGAPSEGGTQSEGGASSAGEGGTPSIEGGAGGEVNGGGTSDVAGSGGEGGAN